VFFSYPVIIGILRIQDREALDLEAKVVIERRIDIDLLLGHSLYLPLLSREEVQSPFARVPEVGRMSL